MNDGPSRKGPLTIIHQTLVTRASTSKLKAVGCASAGVAGATWRANTMTYPNRSTSQSCEGSEQNPKPENMLYFDG